ncbi:MAG: transaldolase [Verrucomicrobiae bacterium]|nr:transaldolase [Verrucomicrobiae bacterium]
MNDYFQWLTTQTKTAWWHDSADPVELERALANGATGVTTNPPLIADALRSSGKLWRDQLEAGNALQITGAVVRSVAAKFPGTVCAQVSPVAVGDRAAMRAMADYLHAIAPNIAVKLPATAAGLAVAEDCIANGITVTLTVSFSVAQAVAIAEMHRRAVAGGGTGKCFAVIMIGRIDDYLRDLARDAKSPATEADIRQAGLAVVKRAYGIYRERGYPTRLCIAALRGTYHLTELAGADLVMSIHPKVQALISNLPLEPGIQRAVPAEVIERLATLADFRRAFEPDGLKPDEFLAYGATQRTLAQFVETGWKPIEAYRP